MQAATRELIYACLMLLRWVPEVRRARALATVYAGYSLGTVVGLLLTPALAAAFQWPAALYAFSFAGLAWAVSACWLLAKLSASCSLVKASPKLLSLITTRMDVFCLEGFLRWRPMKVSAEWGQVLSSGSARAGGRCDAMQADLQTFHVAVRMTKPDVLQTGAMRRAMMQRSCHSNVTSKSAVPAGMALGGAAARVPFNGAFGACRGRGGT